MKTRQIYLLACAFLLTTSVTLSAATSSKTKSKMPEPTVPQYQKAGDRMELTMVKMKYAFRWCPAGTFLMGSPESEKWRQADETQHQVTLTQGFWMLETQVTQEMWQSVMKKNPSITKIKKKNPRWRWFRGMIAGSTSRSSMI